MKKIIALIVVAAVATAVAFVLIPKNEPAPDFRIQTLQGQTLDNAALQGKVTLLNFWFPSCPGCVTEMPKLIQMHADYQGKDFQIVGIAVPVDGLDSVKTYVEQHKLPFTIAFDGDKKVTRSFVQTELFPTSVLINKRGEVLKTFVGEPSFSDLYREVDAELTK